MVNHCGPLRLTELHSTNENSSVETPWGILSLFMITCEITLSITRLLQEHVCVCVRDRQKLNIMSNVAVQSRGEHPITGSTRSHRPPAIGPKISTNIEWLTVTSSLHSWFYPEDLGKSPKKKPLHEKSVCVCVCVCMSACNCVRVCRCKREKHWH